jgi:hypothetical protein
MKLGEIFFIDFLVDVVGFPLACIVELRKIFVFVDISVFADERIFLFEMLGRLLADSVGLAREGFDSYIFIKGLALGHEFKDVSFIHCKDSIKLKLKH